MSTIQDAVTTARESFNSGITKSYDFRLKQLQALLQLVEENSELIEEAITKDFKKPTFEVNLFETTTAKNEIRNVIHKLKGWMEPAKVEKPLPYIMDEVFIHSEPYGVVAIISPWNYPFMLCISPLVGAIAAGNCAIIKPSEITPNCAEILSKLIPRYLNPKCYHVVTGGVPETTTLLEQRFDYIFYTGSSHVGKIIQKAASKYLTPVTLELGGKTPVYVDSTADINLAVRRILWGKCLNAGQSCIAPDYVLCTKEVQEDFIKSAKNTLKTWYGNDAKQSPNFARIVNSNHFRRINKLLNDTDANTAIGGRHDIQDLFIEPTILKDVNLSDPIMQEEIFGPILPIVNVKTAQEATAVVNKGEKPLAVYVFSNDKQVQDMFLKDTSSGNLLINDTMMHFSCDTIPFGGVGNSGIGAYHGKFSFDTFSHRKGTVIKKLDKVGEYMNSSRYPPYTKTNLQMISFLTKKRKWPSFPFLKQVVSFFVGVMAMYIFMSRVQNK
ncbi:hypothetical protein NQ315_001736 [Exocentrus adspersus]|uniref:Aldehyde dehydrogenase n=1 Tax=Exocentrus adspersus TaxID=1586481 RepID=A0AAV8WAH0_9CUCU|nr:hypothetical protein NQ315_001736 [Exocentrus adspersus]